MPENPPQRRRGETLIHHPELLEPISVPQQHYAMIPMEDYERFREFGELVTELQDALEYGRLVGKLEGYRKVLEHVRGSAVLGAGIVNRAGLEEQLARIITALEGDVARLGAVPEASALAEVTGR